MPRPSRPRTVIEAEPAASDSLRHQRLVPQLLSEESLGGNFAPLALDGRAKRLLFVFDCARRRRATSPRREVVAASRTTDVKRDMKRSRKEVGLVVALVLATFVYIVASAIATFG
ncbi:MAG: hypothetical protein K2X07_00020 [Caulobacteraceae bacterium]|nr:hypothetical protein [Caulobacteraceae bacterium]